MSIEQIDAQIAQLQAEISSVERAPRSFDERWPEIEAQLHDAENVFRRFGTGIADLAVTLPEIVARRHVALVGAAVVANKKALLDSERQRIQAQTKGGISAPDKVKRIEELKGEVLRRCARREIAVRQLEGDGFMVRPVHPELLVYTRADLERLAT